MKIYHVHRLEINIITIFILSKAVYRVNAIPIKIPMAFFIELGQIILKCVWSPKRSQIARTNSRKENKVGDIPLPDFKLYYKYIVIKIMVLAQKQTHISMEQNREARNKPMLDWLMNLLERKTEYIVGGRTVSSINGVEETGQLHAIE